MLQEALGNAIKHSGVDRFRVHLRAADDLLTLEVGDDGRGFDVAAALAGHGLGLISMQERLKLIRGEVTMLSAPGVGTVVRVTVPLGPHAVVVADGADVEAPIS